MVRGGLAAKTKNGCPQPLTFDLLDVDLGLPVVASV